MLIRILFVLMLLVGLQATAELELGDDGLPKKDMLKALEPYTGQWTVQIKSEALEGDPNPQTYTAVQEAGYILDKTMFQFRAVTTIDGEQVESLVLLGYDKIEQSYCTWFYGQGGLVVKSRIEWAEDGKSYRSVSLDKDKLGAVAEADVELIDGKTIRWTQTLFTSNDGAVMSKTAFVAERAPVEINYPRRKPAEGEKLAMFVPYTGTWAATISGQGGAPGDEPFVHQSFSNGEFTHDGDVFELRGHTRVDCDDIQFLQLFLYDPAEKQYVSWFHESNGNHFKMGMVWSQPRRTFKILPQFEGDDGGGFKVDADLRLVDDRTIRSSFKVTDPDGRVLMSQETVAHPDPGE